MANLFLKLHCAKMHTLEKKHTHRAEQCMEMSRCLPRAGSWVVSLLFLEDEDGGHNCDIASLGVIYCFLEELFALRRYHCLCRPAHSCKRRSSLMPTSMVSSALSHGRYQDMPSKKQGSRAIREDVALTGAGVGALAKESLLATHAVMAARLIAKNRARLERCIML